LLPKNSLSIFRKLTIITINTSWLNSSNLAFIFAGLTHEGKCNNVKSASLEAQTTIKATANINTLAKILPKGASDAGKADDRKTPTANISTEIMVDLISASVKHPIRNLAVRGIE